MVDDDDDNDEANRAYRAIAAQLAQFSSPQLGQWKAAPRRRDEDDNDDDDNDYDDDNDDDVNMDAVEWMEHDLKITSPPPRTPRRTPILERAHTPIMSNSSSSKRSSMIGPPPHQPPSPVVRGRTSEALLPRPTVPSPRPGVPTSGLHSPLLYRRYHDILAGYLKAKRSLTHSLDLEKQELALEDATSLGSSISALVSREQRTELDYLSQLQQLSWSTSLPLEGDCWMLLVSLRQLGLHALIWENDPTSAVQHTHAIQGFTQQLATSIHDTPEQLLQRLASKEAPFALQRRFVILQWIQTCLDQVRMEPPKTMTMTTMSRLSGPSTTAVCGRRDDPQAALVPEDSFLEPCLGLILAGRMEEAQEVARTQGQPWRAAVWSGGKPLGIKRIPNPQTKQVDAVTTGNPHRFLWKRQMYKTARRVAPVEACISALLAHDLPTCLVSPLLRNWSKAVGAIFMGIWGRLEDEVLVKQNVERRKEALPFDGTEHPQKEQEHLLSTAHLSGMTEDRAMMLLHSSPFEEIKGFGVFESAMAAFLEGKSSIMDYCKRETAFVFGEDANEEAQLAHLRFLTHLMCFLESLQVSTTPIILSDLTKWKNQVLSQYVRYLESRPELWSFIPLYVSLLPDKQRLQWFPLMLAKVLDDTERQHFLRDMHMYFPEDVLPILQTTVRLCLNSQAAPDEIKIQSLRWLLLNDDTYADEAILCSNILLRQFFMEEEDDRLDLAMALVDETLPETLVARCQSSSARVEHLAFLAYLEAYRMFGQWKERLTSPSDASMDERSSRSSSNVGQIDMNHLTPAEQEIAKQRLVRDWIREKRERCQRVIEAAEQARTVLLGTLTYPGGWLAWDEQESVVTTEEERKRRRDMEEIQSRYLTLAVNLYHEVCEGTALWLSRLWEDAGRLMNRRHAEEALKDPRSHPNVWYQHALDVAVVLADDRYGIHQAVGVNALKDIVAKLAETAVSQLMNGGKA